LLEESLYPSTLKVQIMNLNKLPTELAGKLVTVNELSEGEFLTLGSFTVFTSFVIVPPCPSSLKIANPVIKHPPSL
jgi:hypothetical protein